MVRKIKFLLILRADIRTQSGYKFSHSFKRVSRVDYEEMRAELEDLLMLQYISGPWYKFKQNVNLIYALIYPSAIPFNVSETREFGTSIYIEKYLDNSLTEGEYMRLYFKYLLLREGKVIAGIVFVRVIMLCLQMIYWWIL